MTADVELLPLYAELQGHPKLEIIKHYARANVAHATAAKDAEIEALRAEVERLQSDTSFATAISSLRREKERAERLAEALQWYVDNDDTNDMQKGNEFWIAGRERARAALAQEDRNG